MMAIIRETTLEEFLSLFISLHLLFNKDAVPFFKTIFQSLNNIFSLGKNYDNIAIRILTYSTKLSLGI